MTTTIRSDALIAEISPRGAELTRLADREGHELLWDGDPKWWTGRAPFLFPIVGCSPGDRIIVNRKSYPMPKHGFARKSTFTLIRHEPSSCTHRLVSSDATREVYPFDFVLDITFTLDGAKLTNTAELRNGSPLPMPAQFGFHPAFRWPLPFGAKREECEIVFEHPEPADIRRLDDGLILMQRFASPLEGKRLRLDDSLFVNDALIFDTLVSRAVTYRAPSGPSLHIDFPDMPQLGIWTRPGAPYICIEPWQGTAARVGPTGEMRERPGAVVIAPGETRRFAMSVALISN